MTDYLEKAQDKTTTTILLLPSVGTSRRSLLKYGFINGYLADKNHEIQYQQAVYILFKPESWEKFGHHLEREEKSENLIAQYDYAGGYIVLVYSILDQWRDIYPLFMEGQYSRFTQEYKDLFPQMTRVLDNKTGLMSDELTLQYMIFTKAEALQEMWEKELGIAFKELGPDMEVWGKPNMEIETLDIDKIREPVKLINNEQDKTIYSVEPQGGKAEVSEDI
jgi:hypothetical protein